MEGLKSQYFKDDNLGLNWNFQRGGADSNQKAFCGRGMNIFWNNTIKITLIIALYTTMHAGTISEVTTVKQIMVLSIRPGARQSSCGCFEVNHWLQFIQLPYKDEVFTASYIAL